MTHELARIVVAALASMGAHNVKPIACHGHECTARADVSLSYFALDTGVEHSLGFGRCKITLRLRGHDLDWATYQPNECRPVDKIELVPVVAKRAGLAA